MSAYTSRMMRCAFLLAAGGVLAAVAMGQPYDIPLGGEVIDTPLGTPVGPAGPHTNQDECPTTPDGYALPRNGTIIFVDADVPVGPYSGRCWRFAYPSLSLALLDAAQRTGPVEIWVASGFYRPGFGAPDVDATFALRDGVAIYGGFSGDETARRQRNPDPATNGTVLSGWLETTGGPGNGVRSRHVVTAIGNNRSAVLDGFSIIGGFAQSPLPHSNQDGGGLLCVGAGPSIRNCRFAGNDASGWGGGVYVDGGAPLFHECTFIDNAAASGGALAVAGDASPLVRYCRFYGNSAGSAGGAVFFAGSALGCIHGCSFVGNSAGGGGGAAALAGGSLPTLVNSLFNANSAPQGGAVLIVEAGGARLMNCTFTANSAGLGAAISLESGGLFMMRNSIIWRNVDQSGNVGPQLHTNQDNILDIAYTLVQGGADGPGNLNANPQFRDPSGADNVAGNQDDDLRLAPNSPCIDAADNSAFLIIGGVAGENMMLDLAQQPRFLDDPFTPDTGVGPPPVVDMGAYEFNRAATTAPVDPGP